MKSKHFVLKFKYKWLLISYNVTKKLSIVNYVSNYYQLT